MPRTPAIAFAVSLFLAAHLPAQSGAFVMTLGTDTVQVEQFERTGNTIHGVLAWRWPTARVIRYTVKLGEGDRIESYDQQTVGADGKPGADSSRLTMQYAGDSIFRDVLAGGRLTSHRIASAQPAYPLGTIAPGISFEVFELALKGVRTSAPAELWRLAPIVQVTTPSRTRILHASADSVVVDYFGQGSFTLAFDGGGRLVRSDWHKTTYKVLVTRIPNADALAFAKRWQDLDAAGKGLVAISLRDTARATVGSTSVQIDYSRPSRRGRVIWGGVVPFDAVWRLGADFATQLEIADELVIGGVAIPAGKYSLWMVPHRESAELIVNKRAGIFGTQYNAANDLVRIPMRRGMGSGAERLTISFSSSELQVDWSDGRYVVAIGRR